MFGWWNDVASGEVGGRPVTPTLMDPVGPHQGEVPGRVEEGVGDGGEGDAGVGVGVEDGVGVGVAGSEGGEAGEVVGVGGEAGGAVEVAVMYGTCHFHRGVSQPQLCFTDYYPYSLNARQISHPPVKSWNHRK